MHVAGRQVQVVTRREVYSILASLVTGSIAGRFDNGTSLDFASESHLAAVAVRGAIEARRCGWPAALQIYVAKLESATPFRVISEGEYTSELVVIDKTSEWGTVRSSTRP